MALQLYSIAVVLVNGSLLSEEVSVKVGRDARAQEVATVVKGFAGLSPGAAFTTIDCENGVPAFDFELNPGKFFAVGGGTLQVVELTVFAANRMLTVKGFITKDNFGHAVNSEAKISFSFVGEPGDWIKAF